MEPARGRSALVVLPIGDDPAAITLLHLGLPGTKWLAHLLDVHVGGFRPGAVLVDASYTALAEIRPLLAVGVAARQPRWFKRRSAPSRGWLDARMFLRRRGARREREHPGGRSTSSIAISLQGSAEVVPPFVPHRRARRRESENGHPGSSSVGHGATNASVAHARV